MAAWLDFDEHFKTAVARDVAGLILGENLGADGQNRTPARPAATTRTEQ